MAAGTITPSQIQTMTKKKNTAAPADTMNPAAELKATREKIMQPAAALADDCGTCCYTFADDISAILQTTIGQTLEGVKNAVEKAGGTPAMKAAAVDIALELLHQKWERVSDIIRDNLEEVLNGGTFSTSKEIGYL